MADLSKLRFNGTDYNVKDASAPLRKFTNYSKTGNLPITSDDTTQTAIGKLEKALDDKINTSAKGTSNGVAELDANGKVPSSQLPSYVDDVLEYSAKSSFPATGETGKIYVDTTTNKTYRWSGSAYVEISESLALGETSSTAYRGDRGKAAYDHSQITNGNPHGTTGANTNLTGYSKGSSKDAVAATDTVNAAIAKHENRINTNQTNILYTMKTGVKNILPIDAKALQAINLNGTWTGNSYLYNGVTYTVNADGSITITRSASSGSDSTLNLEMVVGEKYVGYYLSGGSDYCAIIMLTSTGNTALAVRSTVGVIPSNATGNMNLHVRSSDNPNNHTVYPMISFISDTDFESFALPNSDLTQLEAEDRAELIELVDSGAKNVYNPSRIDNVPTGLTVTRESDGTTLKINGTYSGTGFAYIDVGTFITDRTGVYYLNVITTKTMSEDFIIHTSDGHLAGSSSYNYTTNPYTSVVIKVASGQTFNNDTVKILICTKAAFGVSQKFVPYQTIPKVILNSRTAFTSSTTMTYTGVSYTIPAHTAVRITANLLNSHGNPVEAAIASYANQNIYLAYNEMPTDRTIGVNTVSFMYATTNSIYTVAVLAKFSNATENHVHLVVEKLS